MNKRLTEIMLRARTALIWGSLIALCSIHKISWLVMIITTMGYVFIREWPRIYQRSFRWNTVLYPGLPFLFLCAQTLQAQTWLLMIYPWLVAWAYDTGAYVSGISCGKHKLCPSISPGKTWEGLIGGFLSVFAIHLIFYPQSILLTLCWSILMTAAACLGDLYVSIKKRHAGLKDMGSLLPGHGGMLDRIDSVLGVAPWAYLFLLLNA